MRVLMCGSRDWDDPSPINALLAGLDVLSEGAVEPLVLIHGDARGADKMAGTLAKRWGATVIEEPADWNRHGKAAGPIRNRKMLTEHKPDVVFAFRSNGKSTGTDDMRKIASDAGVPTYTITKD